jgi:manganese/iron transport system permease protein
MGDAISHAILPGVALAYVIKAPFAIGAFIAGGLAAAFMGVVKATTRIREDAVIGVVYTAFFAAGILIISIIPTPLRLQSIVNGNLVGISNHDIWQIALVSVLVLSVLVARWKDLCLFIFDPAHARSIGINTLLLQGILLMLIAGVSVAALQAVGVILAVAMLVTPGATAYLLTDRFGRMVGISVVIGAVTSFLGAYISHFLNASVGGTIVVLQTLVFMVAFFFAPKHGMLASRRMGRRASDALAAGGAA